MSLEKYLIKAGKKMTGKKDMGDKIKDGIEAGIDVAKRNKGKIAAGTAAVGAAAGTAAAMDDEDSKKKKKRPYMEE